MVERRLMETKNLIQDLPCYSEDLLKMVCALLKAYREICQAAYRGIVQPDSEDKRIYSVAWLNELVSRHDQQLTQVLPLFSQVSSEVTASRERIHAVKENLGVCKRLLQCRRDELRKMWMDAVQHKYVLEMLEQM